MTQAELFLGLYDAGFDVNWSTFVAATGREQPTTVAASTYAADLRAGKTTFPGPLRAVALRMEARSGYGSGHTLITHVSEALVSVRFPRGTTLETATRMLVAVEYVAPYGRRRCASFHDQISIPILPRWSANLKAAVAKLLPKAAELRKTREAAATDRQRAQQRANEIGVELGRLAPSVFGEKAVVYPDALEGRDRFTVRIDLRLVGSSAEEIARLLERVLAIGKTEKSGGSVTLS